MEIRRFTALVLTMLMMFQLLTFSAYAADDVTIYPTDDSYIMSGSRWKQKNYGSEGSMMFGSAYDRTTLIKFDLSSVDLSLYNGALLNISYSAAADGGKIDVYTISHDWTEDKVSYANFDSDYKFVVSADAQKGADKKLSFALNRALETVKQSGSTTLAVALKSEASCTSVYSSEASDISLRPSLTLTEADAYISGQYDFKYPEVTQAQFKEEMQKTISKGHPYLLANMENISKVKEFAFGKDETLTELYANVKAEADSLLAKDIINIDKEIAANESYIGSGENAWKQTAALGLVYLVEGDPKYAQRAFKQSEYLCNLDSWGTYQQIDNIRLAFTVSLCYDWLYDWLTDEQKVFLSDNLRRLHLNMVSDVHHNPNKYKYSFERVLLNKKGNHNLMDSCFNFLSAMAFADTDMDFMTDIMTQSLPYFLSCSADLYPDGVWYEGPSYWAFASPFVARFIHILNNAFGHCFGLEDISFMTDALEDYKLYSYSNNGQFNVGDSHFSATRNSEGAYDESFYMMGLLSEDVGLQSYALKMAEKKKVSEPFTVILYDVETKYDIANSLATDKLLRGGLSQALMRSSFDGTQNTFVGMNVKESNAVWTCHNDLGTLAFDALGERWITNNSRETYYTGYDNGTEERYTWYRTRAEAQSVIVVNPSQHKGQDNCSDMNIHTFKSGKGGAYAITDLTNAYATWAQSYSRGIQLADNRRVFVVQDEIVLKEESELYSFFNIYEPQDIEIIEDGKAAILHKNNKKVYVSIDCDADFTLGTMKAEPLETSAFPDPSKPNTPNVNFKKLYLHFDSVKSANIRVCFIPYICDEELETVTCTEFVPMSEWTVSEELKAAPMLENIKINGKDLQGFDPHNRCYETDSDVLASQLTPVYDSSKYTVTVRENEKNGALTVLLTDKSDSSNINSYLICKPYVPELSFVDTSDMSLLTIKNTNAPEPQSENGIANMYDGDLSTRWSAQGAGTVMTITLDKARTVGCVALALASGDQRRTSFDVSLSLDGKTYTHVGDFISSGITLDHEYYDLGNNKAQYVKITWNGNTKDAWNSITELEIYGK